MRGSLLCAALLLFLACHPAHAIGGRIHAEIGMKCVDDYLVHSEAMLPGLGKLFSRRDNRRILYQACAFPDWGYGGINQDAGEASHWHPFMRAYADVFRDKGFTPALDAGSQQEMAFFLGAVCHNIADLPWHFSSDGNPSFLAMSDRIDGAGHTDTEIGSDVLRYQKDRLWHWSNLLYYAPMDTLMEVFIRAGVETNRKEVERGIFREGLVLWAGPPATAWFVDDIRRKIPWAEKHIEDYYFGGINHNAAACAVWCRYWYAESVGAHCLQQMPAYGAKHKDTGGYRPYLGVADAALVEDLPENNTGMESFLTVGGAAGARRVSLLRFDLTHLPADTAFSRATLWMCLSGVDGTPPVIEALGLTGSWGEGAGQSDPFNGKTGRVSEGGEVSWTNRPGMTDSTDVPRAAADVDLRQPGGAWLSWDITGLVREWMGGDEHNHGVGLAPVGDGGVAEFYSSQAFRAGPDGYCGGTRIAFRPMLVLLP